MPRIASSVKDEIKLLNIVDVISYHMELTRKGNSVVGLCPFHNEKTPSFHVNENQGYYKCFGCNEAGDVITFVMKFKNLDYPDAIEYLCENFGIELRYEMENTPQKPIKELKLLHEKIAAFAKNLLHSAIGADALKYLTGRGFTKDLIERFDLGFLPANFQISAFEKEFSKKILVESGIFYDTRYGLRSLFAGRILFPIRSATGACIAFSGRAMDPEEKAKYKNSPETAIFSKRKELYNLNSAKDAMKEDKSCFIVEGYFDVMRMADAGYTNTVAIMGTAFTKDQISQLKRYAEEYNLLLDGDEAGLKAMRDSRIVALESNIYPNIILLPAGEDPDSFIIQKGKEKFDRLVSSKQDLFLYTIESERAKGTDVNRRFYRLEGMKRMLKLIQDPYRREYYAKETARIFEINENILYSDITANVEQPVVESHVSRFRMRNLCEKEFVFLLTQLPDESAERLINEVKPEYLEDEEVKKVYKKIIELYGQSDIITLLLNDPDLGELSAELLLREPHTANIYEAVYACKEKILQNNHENKIRSARSDGLSAMQDDERVRLRKDEMEQMKKLRRQVAN